MLAPFTEHLDEHVRGAIDHHGVLGELRRGVHDAVDTQESVDSLEGAAYAPCVPSMLSRIRSA